MEKFNTGDRVIVTYTGKKGVVTSVHDRYVGVRLSGMNSPYIYSESVLKHDTTDSISLTVDLSVSLLLGFQTFVIFAMNDLDLAGMIGGLAMYVTSFMVLKRN
jgi:hypothetical protein